MIAIHKDAFVQQYIVQQSIRRATSSEFGVGIKAARGFTGGLRFVAETILRGY